MLHNLFSGIFETSLTTSIGVKEFLICIIVSLFAGFLHSVCYAYKSKYTKSFVVTLATLPAIVCVVILMVNGNIGTGVAVAGVFSLVRFRSIPGTAKEIGAIFIAMGAGLVFGMGYIAYGIMFTAILSFVTLLYTYSGFGEKKISTEKTLTITIPEDLNYTNVFTDIMMNFTNKFEMTHVKTTNMGSMFKITYNIELKNASEEKEFIDVLRQRNGNLEIAISPLKTNQNEL